MKRISIVGLCLAAVFAFSAMAASSASAADLLARPAGGGSIVGVTFLSSAGLTLLTTHSKELIDCTSATNHGVFSSATLGEILIRFKGCKSSGFACSSAGAEEGEIHLPLATTLFHLGLAHLTGSTAGVPAAVILLDQTIEFTCFVVPVKVRGAVIGVFQRNGQAVPLNTPFLDVDLNFQQTTPTSHGLQHFRLILMPGTTGLTTYDLEANVNNEGFQLAAQVAKALLDGFKLSNGKEDDIEFVEP
jgi:hypothetical protein